MEIWTLEGTDMNDRPMAAPGLTSYRCKGRYGWIMIGAKDHADAMQEARRSDPTARAENLEIWNGERYRSLTQLTPEEKAARDSFRQEFDT